MTVPNTVASVIYPGTGLTATFAIPFRFVTNTDLVVQTSDSAGVITTLALTADYTLTGVGLPSGGTVTLIAGNLPVGSKILVARQPEEVQGTSLPNGGPYFGSAIEGALDLLTMQVQALQLQVESAIRIPLFESIDGIPSELPVAAARANGYQTFDGNGLPTVTPSPIVIANTSVPVVSLVQVVDTIALLKALSTPSAAVTYFVRGYYAIGDGGGGIFRWNIADASTDNGGTVIAPNAGSGRWNRILEGGGFSIDARWFGAKCDGTTDDTTELQSALDYFAGATTRTHAGLLDIPGGTVISATLTMANKSVTIRGTGWGTSAEAPLSGYIKWNGAAGIPMLKISDGFGAGVENIRFIGKSTSKPSCAIEIAQTLGGQTNMATSLRRLWIGSMYGLDSDFNNQFTAGITFTGTTNGDSNTLEHIRITGCDNYGIDVINGNAGDINLNGVFIQVCGVGIRTAASVSGQNILVTNSVVADFRLVTGGKIYIQQYVSESSARIAYFDGNNVKLVLSGSWQASANVPVDGIIFDVLTSSVFIVHLENFALQFAAPYTGAVPKFKLYKSGGAITSGVSRLINTWGIYPSNLDFGTMIFTNDSRQITYIPAQENGQDVLVPQQLLLDYTKAANRTFQVARNDFAGKHNIYGGDLIVNALAAPVNLVGTVIGGGSGTTYGYRVTALTYAGETTVSLEVTTSNAAVLDASHTNKLTWNPVQGAYAYKVYGRTAGAELLMATVTFDTTHPGAGTVLSPVQFIDDGSITPSGALPTVNTTGNAVVDGKVSALAGAVFAGATPTAAAGQVAIGGTVAGTVGAAGAATALPAQPLGYLQGSVAGVLVKIPYYNN